MSTKLDKANQWLMLVTNFGIIAGFVLVAVQIQQNTKALRIDALERYENTGIAAESAMMGETIAEAYAKALTDPEELTDSEILQMSGYLTTRLWSNLQLFEGYEAGLVSKQIWEERKLSYIRDNNFPFARAYFSSVSQLFPQSFAREIDQAYQAIAGEKFIHIEALKDALVRELRDN